MAALLLNGLTTRRTAEWGGRGTPGEGTGWGLPFQPSAVGEIGWTTTPHPSNK